jgi:hypothetical protein
MGMKQKKIKMTNSKSPKTEQFPTKCYGLVLGLVGSILLNLYGRQAVQRNIKKGAKTQKRHF